MMAIDITDLPIHRDDPSMWGQFGWLSSPPAIVQTVEESWNYLDLEAAYRCDFEIILKEQNGEIQVERYVSENGSVVVIDEQAENTGNGNSLPEKLDAIKTRLGIGMKHLAAMLGVERPTVYAWTSGERQPQPKRWERIHSLLELADYWQELSQHPLSRRIFVPMNSGQSVMDLLSGEILDVPRVRAALQILSTDESDRSARLKEKSIALRERVKAKGVKPLPAEVVDQTIGNLSGW